MTRCTSVDHTMISAPDTSGRSWMETWSSCYAIHWHPDPVPTQNSDQPVLLPALQPGARWSSQGSEGEKAAPALHHPLSSTAMSFLRLINPEPVFDPTKQDCGYLGGWACHEACRQTAARLGHVGSLVIRTEVLHRVNPRACPAPASDRAPGGQLIIVLRNSKSSLPVLLGGEGGGRWINKSPATVCNVSQTLVCIGITLKSMLQMQIIRLCHQRLWFGGSYAKMALKITHQPL